MKVNNWILILSLLFVNEVIAEHTQSISSNKRQLNFITNDLHINFQGRNPFSPMLASTLPQTGNIKFPQYTLDSLKLSRNTSTE